MVFHGPKFEDCILKTMTVMSLRVSILENQFFYFFVFGTQPKFQSDISSGLEVKMLRKILTVILKTGM